MQKNVSSESRKRKPSFSVSLDSLSSIVCEEKVKKKPIMVKNAISSEKAKAPTGNNMSKMASKKTSSMTSSRQSVKKSESHDKAFKANKANLSKISTVTKKVSQNSLKKNSSENSNMDIQENSNIINEKLKTINDNNSNSFNGKKSTSIQDKNAVQNFNKVEPLKQSLSENIKTSVSMVNDCENSGQDTQKYFERGKPPDLKKNNMKDNINSFLPTSDGSQTALHFVGQEQENQQNKDLSKTASYASVAANNTPSSPTNQKNDEKISPERGIRFNRIPDTFLNEYTDAIIEAIGDNGLTHISLVSKKHVLAFLSDVSHVKFLVINGLSMKGQSLNPSYMRPPALKIVLSNVYPLISNSDIIKLLEPYGRVIQNSFRDIRASTNRKSVLSFRKEILFVPKADTDLPSDVQASAFGYSFRIYLSKEGLKCSNCHKQGHPSSKCRQKLEEEDDATAMIADSEEAGKSNAENANASRIDENQEGKTIAYNNIENRQISQKNPADPSLKDSSTFGTQDVDSWRQQNPGETNSTNFQEKDIFKVPVMPKQLKSLSVAPDEDSNIKKSAQPMFQTVPKQLESLSATSEAGNIQRFSQPMLQTIPKQVKEAEDGKFQKSAQPMCQTLPPQLSAPSDEGGLIKESAQPIFHTQQESEQYTFNTQNQDILEDTSMVDQATNFFYTSPRSDDGDSEESDSDSNRSFPDSIYSMDSSCNESSELPVHKDEPLSMKQIRSLLKSIHKKQGETRSNIVRSYTDSFHELRLQLEHIYMRGLLWKNKTNKKKLRSSKSCLKHLIHTVSELYFKEKSASDQSFEETS